MTRTDVTYGQLDKALLSLGFRCRTVDLDGQYRALREGGGLVLEGSYRSAHGWPQPITDRRPQL